MALKGCEVALFEMPPVSRVLTPVREVFEINCGTVDKLRDWR
jgi:hypothetical protein